MPTYTNAHLHRFFFEQFHIKTTNLEHDFDQTIFDKQRKA